MGVTYWHLLAMMSGMAGRVEEELVRPLISSPDLMALIDDFYWEHHVNIEPMNRWWKTHDSPLRMNDSLVLFTTLRSAGVRAHSWT